MGHFLCWCIEGTFHMQGYRGDILCAGVLRGHFMSMDIEGTFYAQGY